MRAQLFCIALGLGIFAMALDESIRRDPMLAILFAIAGASCVYLGRHARAERAR